MTKNNRRAWIGGVVCLLEYPQADGRLTHHIPWQDHDTFVKALLQLGAKEVEGPLINGIYAVISDDEQHIQNQEAFRLACLDVFNQFLRRVKR